MSLVKDINRHLSCGDCRKVGYPTPAAAKKALRNHGYRIGARYWYKCPRRHAEPTYHLTSQKRSV